LQAYEVKSSKTVFLVEGDTRMFSVLDRHELLSRQGYLSKLSATQLSMDRMSENFSTGAANPYTLAGMVAGTLAYRYVSFGAYSVATKLLGNSGSLFNSFAARAFSTSLGFASEVFAFEGSQRVLQVKWGGANSSLLDWSGEYGFRKGLLHSAITLGTLKFSGAMMPCQNIILQHVLSDTALVASHQFAARIGVIAASKENYLEQYIHAEVSLLQLQVGMSFVHYAFPKISGMGSELKLENEAKENSLALPLFKETPPLQIGWMSSDGLAASDPSSPRSSVKIGDVIDGKYKVEALLGKGGMGLVYRVRHVAIDKVMALKVLSSQWVANAEADA